MILANGCNITKSEKFKGVWILSVPTVYICIYTYNKPLKKFFTVKYDPDFSLFQCVTVCAACTHTHLSIISHRLFPADVQIWENHECTSDTNFLGMTDPAWHRLLSRGWSYSRYATAYQYKHHSDCNDTRDNGTETGSGNVINKAAV